MKQAVSLVDGFCCGKTEVSTCRNFTTFLAQFHWSSNIYNMMPFVASMIILAFTSKNSMAPKAEGIPYDKGSR